MLSQEQSVVVDTVVTLNNCVVIARAGAGKTTTAIEAGRCFFVDHAKPTLILTYNAALKESGRQRVRDMGLEESIHVHSFHAAANTFYNNMDTTGTDLDVEKAIAAEPKCPLNFGLIVVDEAQDLTPLFYNFICKLRADNTCPTVLLVMGDPFQCINQYKGASTTYIEEPEYHFGGKFERLFLSHSWRFGKTITNWINENHNPCSLELTHPKYWETHGKSITSMWNGGVIARPVEGWGGQVCKIRNYKQLGHVLVDKIFGDPQFRSYSLAILGYSLRSNRDVHDIINRTCSDCGVDWHVDIGAGGYYNSDASTKENKKVATTIHRSKGVEYDIVVLVGMDNYFETPDGTESPLAMTNAYYVAASRAKHLLIVMDAPCPQKEFSTLRKTPSQKQPSPPPRTVTVAKIINDLTNKFRFASVLTWVEQSSTLPVRFIPEFVIQGRGDGTVEAFGRHVDLLVQSQVRTDTPTDWMETLKWVIQNDSGALMHLSIQLLPFLEERMTAPQRAAIQSLITRALLLRSYFHGTVQTDVMIDRKTPLYIIRDTCPLLIIGDSVISVVTFGDMKLEYAIQVQLYALLLSGGGGRSYDAYVMLIEAGQLLQIKASNQDMLLAALGYTL